jgi:hypothetical protein
LFKLLSGNHLRWSSKKADGIASQPEVSPSVGGKVPRVFPKMSVAMPLALSKVTPWQGRPECERSSLCAAGILNSPVKTTGFLCQTSQD